MPLCVLKSEGLTLVDFFFLAGHQNHQCLGNCNIAWVASSAFFFFWLNMQPDPNP